MSMLHCANCGAILRDRHGAMLPNITVTYVEYQGDDTLKADYFCNDACTANFFFERSLRSLDA